MTAPLESADLRRSLAPRTLMRIGAATVAVGLAVGFTAVAGPMAARADDPVNTPPTAEDDFYTTAYETTLFVSDQADGVLANDSDPDDADLDLDAVDWGTPSVGDLVGYNGSQGTFEYQPPAGFSGEVTIQYYAHDHKDRSLAPATIHIDVLPQPNDSPVAVNDSYTIGKNQTLAIVAPGFLGNDTDTEGDTILLQSIYFVGGALPGEFFNIDGISGAFTYTPATDFVGARVLEYSVTDGNSESNTATITIDVTEEQVPQATPQGGADSYSTAKDTTLVVTAPGLLANDSDADSAFQIGGYSDPGKGSITAFQPQSGAFTYVPEAGFVGTTSFTYFLRDVTNNESGAITVTIEVTAAQEPGEDEPGEDEPGEDEPGEDEPGQDEPGQGTDLPTGSLEGDSGSGTSTTSSLASTGAPVSALGVVAGLLLVAAGGVVVLRGRARSSAK